MSLDLTSKKASFTNGFVKEHKQRDKPLHYFLQILKDHPF